MSQYSCKHVGIQVNSSQARILPSREHDFWLSLLSVDSTIASTTNLESGPRLA